MKVVSSRSYRRKDAAILEARNAKMEKLYSSGLPQEVVAFHFGVTRQHVQQILKARGVKCRTVKAWTSTDLWKWRREARMSNGWNGSACDAPALRQSGAGAARWPSSS